MERRIAIVLAVFLLSSAALYAADIKLFDSAISAALLNAIPFS
jgi:hypothetical protein